jgi:endonuclease YncB( thermonuclease family)
MIYKALTFIAVLLLLSPSSYANEVEGLARVVDGDTLVIGKQRIRLHGIDAPEQKQLCRKKENFDWACGQAATQALKQKIASQSVKCIGKTYDRYKRLIAVCYLGKTDLNRWMVRNGLSVAYRRYSKDYITEEKYAQNQKNGIWNSEFQMPWTWRKNNK